MMQLFKKLTAYFSRGELLLWGISVLTVLVSFFAFDRENYLTLTASLIGATSLILNAKGNPAGQVLMVAFSMIYGIISYTYAYYGEMITYLGMSLPMAVFALISWLRHPYRGNHAEVEINRLRLPEYAFMAALTAVVTFLFYFILGALNTANLAISTVSVATSFSAVYLVFRRSPYYAVAYAANDIVLIVMWIFATKDDRSYLSVVLCFFMFLANDIYGFVNWNAMRKRQAQG